ncbi:MAG: hypothetical protein FJ088_15745 [Deltaproteobacteria bacterium]|nr:hypothetical protein [Deltaproteobacteria bacterium]
MQIVFLHHSTGEVIWNGGVSEWFDDYNKANNKDYAITEMVFPKDSPYGWENYPYDYWNIWVNHAGNDYYMEEPTLEILTKTYDVIVWKHCFPVRGEPDSGTPDVSSSSKTIENYKVQYAALKDKMKDFSGTKFVVWTPSAQREDATTPELAQRADQFYKWVKNEWDEKGDNIFLWDFRLLETEGGLYILDKNSSGAGDSHPNEEFAKTAAPRFGQRVADVIEGKGDTGSLTGE